MNPEFPGLVTASGHHATFIPSYQYRFAFQGRIVDDLYGNKKRVEVKMSNMSGGVIHEAKVNGKRWGKQVAKDKFQISNSKKQIPNPNYQIGNSKFELQR
jgi:hypothetical protein